MELFKEKTAEKMRILFHYSGIQFSIFFYLLLNVTETMNDTTAYVNLIDS